MTALTNRSATAPNDSALGAFLAAKRQIDHMLARIQTLSDDHFDTDPDAIHWGRRRQAEPLFQPAAPDHRHRLQRGRIRQVMQTRPDQAPRWWGLLAYEGPHPARPTKESPMTYQTLLHELVPSLNPAGVEASIRLRYGTLDHLPRETFVAEAKLAADLEAHSPGILRKIAGSMGMAGAFAK